jgi:ComF family protein
MNGFDAAYSFGAYEGVLRELVHLLKYRGVHTLAGPLGGMMASAFPRDERFDMIVPMPIHWWRRWRRGYNQSLLLAKELGRRTGIPVVDTGRRTRRALPQAGLSNAQRRSNVAGTFSVRDRARIEGRDLLLVDDVFTTGATAGACSRALKRAGARHVSVLTLARTDRRWNTSTEITAGRSRKVMTGAAR